MLRSLPRARRLICARTLFGSMALGWITLGLIAMGSFSSAQECATWPRALPPEGLEIPETRLAIWKERLGRLDQQLAATRRSPYWADVEVLAKACRLAIEFREFYSEKDFAKCDRLLKLAEERVAWLKQSATSDLTGPLPAPENDKRLQVRGFVSRVDGSAQPIGLIMPEQALASTDRVPLFVWLHGRGDKSTDLHFLCERQDRAGEVAPAGVMVLHAFGRQCVGYKSAGTTDVMEAIDFVCANYPVDQQKIVLIGFSMGGAGAWHLAARNSDRFVAVSPGAGFAETARYQNLTPDRYPAKYTQTLWGVYDVPGYTRNLFNMQVIAYSGENDKQIQAARVMEEAFQEHGRTLTHLIGPGMGHKYHPEVLKQLLDSLVETASQGQQPEPDRLYLQTRHLRVHRTRWISIEGQIEPYADTRVDAARDQSTWKLTTKNVSRLQLDLPPDAQLVIDGQSIDAAKGQTRLVRTAQGQWQVVAGFEVGVKRPGLSGPIDDAFFDPFLIVLPSGKSSNRALNQWVDCEAQYQIQRWRSLMRGQPRVKRDVDVTAEDIAQFHLVLWGDPESNSLVAKLLQYPQLPLKWSQQSIQLGSQSWPAESTVPTVILPHPESSRYVVLNSGLTFRDGHDRTNSLQNPQLPDWAMLDLKGPRTAQAAGPVLAAGFFDDQWRVVVP